METLLIVEDSKTIGSYLERMAKQAFPMVTVARASEGAEALEFLRQIKADAVITDIEMPGMDGVSFLKKAYADNLLEDTARLVLSSAVSPQTKEDLAEIGPVILKKPATPDDIIQALQT